MSAEPTSRGPDESMVAGEVEVDEEAVEAVGMVNVEVFIAETKNISSTHLSGNRSFRHRL